MPLTTIQPVCAIRDYLLALPEAAAWPALVEVFEVSQQKPRLDWELPLLACESAGGQPARALPAAAAIACMQISIILVDDMLDDDPRGQHNQIGAGAAANLALAYQAAALRILLQAEVDDQTRTALAQELGRMGHATALGQHWDTQNLADEAHYWRVVAAKSTPFYGAAFYLGALCGQAAPPAARALRQFGVLLGEMIQIQDDLIDAFQLPANPDWRPGRNNLLLLYAQTVNHAGQARFRQLRAQANDMECLQEAQDILIRCGAVSYAAYQLMARYETGRQIVTELNLTATEKLTGLLSAQIRPMKELLQDFGIES